MRSKESGSQIGVEFYWGEGRGVVRRPEARGSNFAEAHVLSPGDAKPVLEAVVHSVERRQQLTDEERAKQRRKLAQLATSAGIDYAA